MVCKQLCSFQLKGINRRNKSTEYIIVSTDDSNQSLFDRMTIVLTSFPVDFRNKIISVFTDVSNFSRRKWQL